MELSTSGLGFRNHLRFVGTVTAAHVITYVIAGTLAYQFIYESAIAAGGFDAYLISWRIGKHRQVK